MLTISRNQAHQRFTTLSEVLQEVLLSENNAAVASQIAQSKHVPEERIAALNIIVGDVIMGFLHFEDAPREIAKDLSIAPQLATEIWLEIERKLLAPLRGEIEKLYSPPGIGYGMPRIVLEIKKPAPPQTIKAEIPQVARTTVPVVPPVAAESSQKTATPPPFMIHKETRPEPLKIPVIDLPADQKLKEVKLSRPEPLRPAQIEMGLKIKLPQALADTKPKKEEKLPKVVDYAIPRPEFIPTKPPLSAAPSILKPAEFKLTPAPQTFPKPPPFLKERVGLKPPLPPYLRKSEPAQAKPQMPEIMKKPLNPPKPPATKT